MAITRGTTPTIKYTFKTVDPAHIVVAYFVISQGSSIVLEKKITDAVVTEHALEFSLTQEETLRLNGRPDATMQLRYRLDDGSAHATKIVKFPPGTILKDGEI